MEIHKCANKIYTTDDDDNQQPTTDNDNDNNDDEGGGSVWGTNGTDGKVDTIDRTAEGGCGCMWYSGDRPTNRGRMGMGVCCCVKKFIQDRPLVFLYNAMLSHALHAVAPPARTIIIFIVPSSIHRHPNKWHRLRHSFVVLLLRLAWRRYRTAHIHASIRVLCLLLGWFQNLPQVLNLTARSK